MTDYGASIQLTDKMTPILNNIIEALNMTVSTVYDMQSAVDGFDTSSLNAVQDAIAQAEVARDSFVEEMNKPITPPVVTWSSGNFDVFTNTGIERFVAESQSALNMMNQLTAKQQEIAANAQKTDVFSDTAVSDVTNIGTRMTAIQNRIQQIESNPANPLDPNASNELEQLRQKMSQALSIQEQMNDAVNDIDLGRANSLYYQLNNIINQTEQAIRDNVDEQGKFNSSVDQGTTAAVGLESAVRKVVSAFGLYKIADILQNESLKLIALSDQMTGYEARISLLVDEDSVADVKNKIYNAAQSSRGDYAEMMNSVSRLGMLAGDAFADATGNVNFDEVIKFLELMNKNFVIGGASATEQASAMYQLTQAMGSGRLQGDEYRSIIENAPLLAQSIEDYMQNVVGAEGTMKEWAADGLLTADVIKNAVFSNADEVEARFNTMPMTWAQVMTQCKNQIVGMFEPILNQINELANNEEFVAVFNQIQNALSYIGGIAAWVINLLANGAIWISNNWSSISPILFGIAAAIGVVCAAMLIYNIYLGIKKAIEIASCLASYAHAAATGTQASATAAATAAQYGFNTALLASPVTWIIIAIAALIAIIFVVIGVIKKATGTTTSAIGMIFGAVCWVGALILNTVIGLVNAVIQFLWTRFVEPFIGIIEWVLNVCNGGFDSFGGAVANLVGNIISWFLSLGQVVTKIIDAIFGTNWTAGLESLKNTVTSWGKTDTAITLSREAPQINYRMDMTDAYSWGASKGDAFSDKMSDMFSLDTLTDTENYANYEATAENTALTAENTGDLKDAVGASASDTMEWLRKITEREAVNKFTTAEIKLEFTSNATLNSDMDIDGLINRINDELQETLVSTAEGLER